METNEIIKYHRKRLDLTQQDLGNKLGVRRAAVQKWESGATENIKRSTLEELAKIFNITAAELLGFDEEKNYTTIDIYGRVVAGTPEEAFQDWEGRIEISEDLAKRGEYYGLKVKGLSMEPYMLPDDLLIIRKQAHVENGEVAIVAVNSNDATVKQVKFSENGIMLIPFNSREFSPVFYTHEDIEKLPVEIKGKVVEVRRSLEDHPIN